MTSKCRHLVSTALSSIGFSCPVLGIAAGGPGTANGDALLLVAVWLLSALAGWQLRDWLGKGGESSGD